MTYMDMLDGASFQFHRIASTHPGMQQSLQPGGDPFIALKKRTPDQRRNLFRPANTKPRRLQQHRGLQGHKNDLGGGCMVPESVAGRSRLANTSGDDLNAAPPELRYFLSDVRFHRGGKLIREVSKSQHG